MGPLIANSLTEEKGYKQDTIRSGNSSYIKILFILLTKVIAIYMQFFIV